MPSFTDRLGDELKAQTALISAHTAVAQAVNERRAGMAIGSGKMASDIVGGIKDAVARAMTDARAQIGGATDELVAEIKSGAQNVKRAIQVETANVRQQFGEIVGNATDAAEEAIAEAKQSAEGANHG